ncbi:hypothetical protein AMELA_G00039230 [Ameiurus melas]|uniref:Uncharacterized protein n=1 Tax=Ameiurus melas TaxID=219545 RepID=A0A7J6B9B3_AMEME|nr:hypothetical protein AMELA_G00039230 [Ameiurus melas]
MVQSQWTRCSKHRTQTEWFTLQISGIKCCQAYVAATRCINRQATPTASSGCSSIINYNWNILDQKKPVT